LAGIETSFIGQYFQFGVAGRRSPGPPCAARLSESLAALNKCAGNFSTFPLA
jgi:hypothetical protein